MHMLPITWVHIPNHNEARRLCGRLLSVGVWFEASPTPSGGFDIAVMRGHENLLPGSKHKHHTERSFT